MAPTEAPISDAEVHTPEEGAPEYGENNENLPDEIVQLMKEIVIEVQKEDESGKFLRRIEVMREWQNSLYEQGTQHIYWTGGGSKDAGGFAMVMPNGLVTLPGGIEAQAPRFVDDYNFFTGYCNILTAVQTQDDPDIDFRAKNASQPNDVAAASEAECYREIYDEQNDVSATDVSIFRKMLLSGRVVTWTRTETDPERFGYSDDARTQPVSFECTDVYGTVDSRVPLTAKNQRKCFYCILIEDQDVVIWKAKYPDWAEKLKGGEGAVGESIYERNARLGIIQNGGRIRGTSYPEVTARSNCWLRPSNWFRKCVTDKEGMQDELNRLFPMGCHVTFVGKQYVGSWAESMDDCLTIVGGLRPDQGMFQQAIADPMTVEQDAYNDGQNAMRLIGDTGWGSTWWAADETEFDAAVRQRADPGAIRLLKDLPAGTDAGSRFFHEPDVEVSEWFVKWQDSLRSDLPQFQLAAQPALFGGSLEENKTASGYAQANKNASGTQGLPFRVKKSIWASIYYQAALACAKAQRDTPMVAPNGRQLDTQKLKKGKFGVYVDKSGGNPESVAAKRQIMANIVSSPMGPTLMMVPQNAREALDKMGYPQLVVPEAEAGEKQLFEIQELLKSGPVPPDPAMVQQLQTQHAAASVQAAQMGQPAQPFVPPPPKSTVTPDPLDFHEWEFDFCQDWLSGPECRQQMNNGNVAGVNNVRAHAMEHWQMKQQVPWSAAPALIAAPQPKGGPPQPGIGTPAAPPATQALA